MSKKLQKGKYNRRKKESQESEFKRNVHAYQEKMSGNAYLQTDVWIVRIGEPEQGVTNILGFDPDKKPFTLLLAYSSRDKAEAYLKSGSVIRRKITFDKMPLANLVALAMIGTVRNIAIDKLDDDSSYAMLDVIRMKTKFDAGLRLDE